MRPSPGPSARGTRSRRTQLWTLGFLGLHVRCPATLPLHSELSSAERFRAHAPRQAPNLPPLAQNQATRSQRLSTRIARPRHPSLRLGSGSARARPRERWSRCLCWTPPCDQYFPPPVPDRVCHGPPSTPRLPEHPI